MRCLSLLLIVLLVARAGAQDFPSWRGPTGDGQTLVTEAPIRWDQTTNVKWKVPLKRPANGSPIVAKGRVLLTLAEDDEGRSRSIYCFDRRDGKQLWVRTVTLDRTMPTHKTNPYGGTTPASDGERVVVWHASAGLHAYDLDGKELWKRDLGEFRHEWGYGTSPILHDGKVILNTGPGAASGSRASCPSSPEKTAVHGGQVRGGCRGVVRPSRKRAGDVLRRKKEGRRPLLPAMPQTPPRTLTTPGSEDVLA
jgi:hypothetical protein